VKLIFADPTPRWVPFTAAALIVIGVWVGGVWDNVEFVLISKIAVGLASVLFVLIFFQGRYYWKGQVERITATDGEYFEAAKKIWVGRGNRYAFGPHEATGWVARPSSGRKAGQPATLGSIAFSVKGKPLELSFVNPKAVDLAGLSALNPVFFARVKADYPALVSVSGA
jgi:hypothetical protein